MPRGAMCPIHGVNFFKGGKMKSYAHPIEDSDEWCNQDDTGTTHQPPSEESEPPQPTRDTGQLKHIRYGRTFNLGNYESSRLEIEAEYPVGMPDVDCFRDLHRRLAEIKRSLSPNASAPAPQEAIPQEDVPF